jgi:putative heme-binding domain-containing protein
LDSIAENSELATSIDVSRRQLLLQHENESIRKKATDLLGGATRPDRAAVMKEYNASLSEKGDREKGRAVFAKVCAVCHRLDGVGKVVGPNLAGLNNRAPATYLTAILDPNRAVEAKWMMLAGSVVEETSSAITLIGADGARTSVPRSELESLKSTGRSLMPEGLEAAISTEEMTDLLTYIRSTGRPLTQAVVKGNTVEHLGTDHDGFYSISFDPVPGATGIELEWANESGFKHWTVREIEAYSNFETRIDIVAGNIVPGPVRTSNNVFANAFDGDIETFTYTTESGTTRVPQRTLLDLEPGSHTLDRIRINDVAGNGTNGRMKQITVRVTTDAGALTARKYVDVANLSVQIFGEVDSQVSVKDKEPEPSGPFGGKPQTIPGKIETEHYDEGAPGIAYQDNDAKNQGADYRKNTQVDIEKRDDASNGHGIGWTKAGEWLNYTVDVEESGAYDIEILVASQKQGGLFHLEIGGSGTGPIRIPDTGGWTQLKTIAHKGIKLKKGVHVLKFVMDQNGESGYVGDIDCLIFSRAE